MRMDEKFPKNVAVLMRQSIDIYIDNPPPPPPPGIPRSFDTLLALSPDWEIWLFELPFESQDMGHVTI